MSQITNFNNDQPNPPPYNFSKQSSLQYTTADTNNAHMGGHFLGTTKKTNKDLMGAVDLSTPSQNSLKLRGNMSTTAEYKHHKGTPDSDREEELPRLLQSAQKNQSIKKQLFLETDSEVQMRHTLAQDVIGVINENERLLSESSKRLTKFLTEGQIYRSEDTTLFLNNFRGDWVERMKNIAKIFKKIGVVAKGNVADDLRDMVMKTPESFQRSMVFNIGE